jgi:elongation factor 1 alpha-like protein
MDIGIQHFSTPHRRFTILDAPGHRDFIPNMITGAAQADCALMVVNATTGEFESGFDRGGQTREHLVLVRSLGVSQIVIAINKLDQVSWSQERYSEVLGVLEAYLTQVGFQSAKTSFIPVGALQGVNLVSREGQDGVNLGRWYRGPTLVDILGEQESSLFFRF